MKRCPGCRRDYHDNTLLYCLDDGSALLEGPASMEEPATAILSEPPASAGGHAASEPATRPQIHSTEAEPQPSVSDSADKWSFSPHRAAKQLLVLGLSLLLLSAGFFGYRYFAPAKQIESIAVLPFVNASGNAEIEYLSDGITESLIGGLSRIPDLTVKSRSSVFRFKGSDADARTIGRELGVQALLTGRVVQRGQDLTLFVEVIDAATDNSRWQRTYNRPMVNLATLQSDIARDVAEQLRTELSGADKKQVGRNYTDNPEAYRLYMLGNFHWAKRTKADAYKAIDYYRQATALDPNYALAYAGLGDVYGAFQSYDPAVSPRETQELARAYAMRAVAIDDTLSEAHVSLARISYSVDFDFAGAETSLKRAIELNPSNWNAFQTYGYLLMALGRFGESEINFQKGIALEPTSANANRAYSLLLMIAGRYRESEEQLKRTLDLEPNFQIGHLSLANSYMVQGRFAESVEEYAKAREIAGRPDQAAEMRASFARGGWRGFVLDFERGAWHGDLRPKYIDAGRLASIGENKRSLDLLEQSYQEREGFFVLINVDPRLRPLHREPRFLELLGKAGFAKPGM